MCVVRVGAGWIPGLVPQRVPTCRGQPPVCSEVTWNMGCTVGGALGSTVYGLGHPSAVMFGPRCVTLSREAI